MAEKQILCVQILYTLHCQEATSAPRAHCTLHFQRAYNVALTPKRAQHKRRSRRALSRFSPPLRLYLPRRETGALLGDLAKVVAPGLRPHSWSRETIRDAATAPCAAEVPLRRNGRNCGVPSDRTAGRMAQVRSLQRCWYALAHNHGLHISFGARPLHKCTYDQRTHVARRVCGSCCQDMS